MYAGDIAFLYSSRYLSKLQDDLNQELVKLQNWLHGNKFVSKRCTNTVWLLDPDQIFKRSKSKLKISLVRNG